MVLQFSEPEKGKVTFPVIKFVMELALELQHGSLDAAVPDSIILWGDLCIISVLRNTSQSTYSGMTAQVIAPMGTQFSC